MTTQKESDKENKSKNKPNAANNDYQNHPVVVGIGASAGGLNALEEFFKNMPPDTDFVFVVIQHLDPEHKSMLPDILQRSTNMEVVQVEDHMPIEKNTIFVIPPGNDIEIEGDYLQLTAHKTPRGVPLPIDHFFRSLKDWNHERAIGIILSGSGSDGSLGLREIKAENGMIMTQDHSTAGHRGMPDSAIRTGLVDYVLPPGEMPERLIEFVTKSLNKPDKDKGFDGDENKELVNEIFRILRDQSRHDFSEYKYSTIFRRIERRITVNSLNNLQEYVDLLKENPDEVDSLFKEVLIGVTNFFRDKEAYKRLEKLLSKLMDEKKDKTFRVWVAGCSTGEEAYSLAMIINQLISEKNKGVQLQVFASDIDERALEIARAGKYPPNIEADVPKEYLKRYFIKQGNFYQIDKNIRDMVVFANHSVTKDPPYSRLDLMSCRNLLIYLQNSVQEKAIRIFHYALNKDGYLFLGNSESLGKNRDMFSPVDKKWKIFKKEEARGNRKFNWDYQSRHAPAQLRNNENKNEKNDGISLKEFARETILKKFSNPLIIINKEGNILYSEGPAKTYFGFVEGEPSNNIVSAACEELKVPLANGIRKINIEKKELTYENVRIKGDGDDEVVKLSITPIKQPASLSNLFLVYIEPVKILKLRKGKNEKIFDDGDAKDEYVRNVEQELTETRGYLQSVVEELETSNEELKSVNEEAQSTNEELQSTNEELESSKEELQSLNEELETSNAELQRKVMELSKANNDISNFLTSTKIGTIFLDRKMNIQRFTPAVTNIIELLESDIGRPLENFVNKLKYDNLIDDAKNVLNTLVPKETEVNLSGNQYFWMRILPYRTMDDKIEGVVVTFTDITEYKKMQELSELSQYKYKMLFRSMTSGVTVQELIYENGKAVDARVVEANDSYFKHTGVEKEKVIGKRIKEVFPNFSKKLFRSLVKVVENGKSFQTASYVPQFKRHFKISAYKFDDNKYVAIFDDVTSEVEANERVKKSEEKFKGLFTSISLGLSINKLVIKKKKAKTIFIDVNPTMERILGEKSAKINSQPLDKFAPLSNDGLEQKITDAVAAGNDHKTEIFHKEKDKYFHLSALPLQGDQFVMILQDVTDEKKVQLAKQHLAAIVESSQDAVYSVSLDAKIQTWNKGAERFYGYEANEIIGKDVSVLSAKLSHDKHQELINKVKEGTTITSIEFEQVRKNGEKFPVYLTKSPILNENGKIIAISDIVKDISDLKERELQLIREKEKSEKAGRLKTVFLQNVSHEIRTPMNSIIGFTDLLKKRIKDEQNRQFALTIEQSANQLLRLIDDILDISRIEADEIPLEKVAFNLNELMKDLKNQFVGVKESSGKNDIDIQLELPDTRKSGMLFTDRYRLEQVLNNLLSNAVKYTKKGRVVFGYERKKNDLRFYVKDTGVGIMKEHLEKVFTRFERATHKNDKVLRGTGLGLSISKGLVEKLGGKIWAESNPDKGSVFYFTIPDQNIPSEEIELSKGLVNKEVPDLKGKTIMIAEDDEFSLQMMQFMFNPTNVKLVVAKDGNEAVKIFAENEPDLVFLDIRLPGKTGYEILEEIRKINKKVKVIAQTAYAMPEDKRKSQEAGFDAHLAKPLSSDVLYSTINKLLNNK